ncbi:hypothetical protein J19TS2_39440 [Cohnella xylanilytica]|uniref:ATP-binding protein n=1 Tax=Cohnella xylanilytica TaxID=557555 RepID=UPI001B0997D4|nr:ATP-binding protein [Cohnella xylanilytica]GIO14389.1 hypothetical protein J19TS2_39440 [Cohnella xylanilytica]
MMKRRKIAAIVGLFLLALIGLRLAWIGVQTTSARAEAEDGLLDLRRWDPSSQPIFSLSGEWEYVPSRLVTPGPDGAFKAEKSPVETVTVPGSWRQQTGSSFGFGTYRLRILLPSGSLPELTVRVPGISASSALYVNGRLLGGSGRPAERASSYTPSVSSYSATFAADRDVLDIVLQTANYDDRIMGGLSEPVKFGTAKAMNRAYWFSAGSQAAVCLLMLIHALYAFVLYFIGNRQKALLLFSLLGLFGAGVALCDIDRILSSWFGVDYEAFYKVFYLSYLGAAALLLQYLRSLLPEFPALRYARWHFAACVAFGLFVLAAPVKLFTYADGLHTALLVIPFLAAPVFLYRAARRGVPDSIYLLLGAAAVLTNTVWGLLNYSLFLDIGYYPFDMLAFFVSFALYWFKRYFRNAAETVRLAERLQAADKRKDEFLVHTSHELRNPLHGILNMAQSVLDSGERSDEETNRERLALLVSVGKRMSFLLSDLIELNRLRENRLRLKPAPLLLQAETAGVLDMVRFMSEGKPVRLENRVPDTLPAVLADENRLVQILFNLLHNAVKFTNEGVVSIEAHVEGDKVVVRVADTGIGMDGKTLSRIFQPYEQGANEEETNAAGFGLGLTIGKRLVELHGGELTADSTPGVGSVFRFTLPLAKADGLDPAGSEAAAAKLVEEADVPASVPAGSVSASAAASNAAEADGSMPGASISDSAEEDRPRILAVDDDPVNLRILTNVLGPDRYEIVTTTSGFEALSLLNSGSWDLLVADVMMPDISGYEVARTVRTIYSPSELPILLLTARQRAEDIEAGFRAGANDYVVKPVDAAELRMRVKALTDVARAAREQKRLEAAWLQAQIQPHFLFNTLNSIAALGDEDTARMRDLLVAFGDYLRASFDSANSDQLVPLRKELDLVRAYLYIEKERFGQRVRVEWEADDHLQLRVPPLSVQPLVENAVRHGLLRRSKGGTVRIRTEDLGDRVEISVEDDGVGMEPGALPQALRRAKPLDGGSGIGLANTNRRLKQQFGEGLLVRSRPGEGTVVSFVVPKERLREPARPRRA